MNRMLSDEEKDYLVELRTRKESGEYSRRNYEEFIVKHPDMKIDARGILLGTGYILKNDIRFHKFM